MTFRPGSNCISEALYLCASSSAFAGPKSFEPAPVGDNIGSSPRSRGTRRERLERFCPGRFIPALAGNTCARKCTTRCGSVHPRARGEHGAAATRRWTCSGSSPRSRGTLLSSPGPLFLSRFIPALAGNTQTCPSPSRPEPVHPRARGEYAFAGDVERRGVGSSPRSRGTREGADVAPARRRFIPALAGNT